jgi:hypothetical protein
MSVVMTRRFQDEGGNVLYLRLKTGKRIPFLLKVQHGSQTGTLATATDEASAMAKLDKLVDQAEKQGWKEVLGRDGLTEIPAPSTRPVTSPKLREVRGGGSKRSASR